MGYAWDGLDMRGMGISIIRTWSAVLERCTVRVFDILKAYSYESHVYASRRVRVPNDLGVTPRFARYRMTRRI